MKIMLVDDSRTIRNIQKRVLAKLGYEDIVEAADGVEALAAYVKSPPDLLLVDCNMPNLERFQSTCSVYPACLKQLTVSDAVTSLSTVCIELQRRSRVRAPNVRSSCFILLNTISIGFRSGL